MSQNITLPVSAYGYIRVSTETQADKGYGLDVQKEAIKNYCLQNNINLIKIFADEGITGKMEDKDDISIRPELTEMLNLLETQEQPKTVIVMNTSRLWRDDNAKVYIVRQLRKSKVDVIATEQPRYSLYSKDPQDFLFNAIMEALDTYERMTINNKLANGKKQRTKQGKSSNGKVPYGYTNIKDKPVIITEEAEIVKLIYNLSEQNFGIRKISEYLRKNNILTATNTNFSDGKIFNILTNPFYTGKILYQGELHSGVHEPIITQEQYDIVNTKYNNKRYKVA